MDFESGALRNDSKSKYVFFNKTHKNSLPKPKGTGPNGGRLQSHHGLQQQWAIDNLSKYGYDAKLAPTVTIETGMEMPHTIYRIYKIREEMLVSQVVMVSGVQAYKMNYHILFRILERQVFLIPQLIVC